jgi:integrase
MKMIDLIRHYERVKTQHQPLSASLGEKLVQLRDAFGSLPAASDGMAIIKAARSYWPRAQEGTLKRNLGQLRAVIRAAARDGLVSTVPHIEMPAVYDVRDVEISTTEMSHLLDFIEGNDPEIYPVVLLLMHTGGRLGEVWAIHKPDDLVGGCVVYRKPRARKSKTAERRVPYSGRLSLCIDAGLLKSPQGFGHASPKRLGNRIRVALTRACVSLGLPVIRVHDLRHCFASLTAEAGADIADICSLLGHSNIGTTMRYRGLVQQKAVRLLSAIQ